MAGNGRLPPGRSDTLVKKLITMKRLLAAWTRAPDLRLGQLIDVSLQPSNDLFYVEDDVLIAMIETFINSKAQS